MAPVRALRSATMKTHLHKKAIVRKMSSQKRGFHFAPQFNINGTTRKSNTTYCVRGTIRLQNHSPTGAGRAVASWSVSRNRKTRLTDLRRTQNSKSFREDYRSQSSFLSIPRCTFHSSRFGRTSDAQNITNVDFATGGDSREQAIAEKVHQVAEKLRNSQAIHQILTDNDFAHILQEVEMNPNKLSIILRNKKYLYNFLVLEHYDIIPRKVLDPFITREFDSQNTSLFQQHCEDAPEENSAKEEILLDTTPRPPKQKKRVFFFMPQAPKRFNYDGAADETRESLQPLNPEDFKQRFQNELQEELRTTWEKKMSSLNQKNFVGTPTYSVRFNMLIDYADAQLLPGSEIPKSSKVMSVVSAIFTDPVLRRMAWNYFLLFLALLLILIFVVYPIVEPFLLLGQLMVVAHSNRPFLKIAAGAPIGDIYSVEASYSLGTKVVTLIPMMHAGDRKFFQKLSYYLSGIDDAVVLTESPSVTFVDFFGPWVYGGWGDFEEDPKWFSELKEFQPKHWYDIDEEDKSSLKAASTAAENEDLSKPRIIWLTHEQRARGIEKLLVDNPTEWKRIAKMYRLEKIEDVEPKEASEALATLFEKMRKEETAFGFSLQRFNFGVSAPSLTVPGDPANLRIELEGMYGSVSPFTHPIQWWRSQHSTTDLHRRREDHVVTLAHSINASRVVIPWGASHIAPISEKLQRHGFSEMPKKKLRLMMSFDTWNMVTKWWNARLNLLMKGRWPSSQSLFMHLHDSRDSVLDDLRWKPNEMPEAIDLKRRQNEELDILDEQPFETSKPVNLLKGYSTLSPSTHNLGPLANYKNSQNRI